MSPPRTIEISLLGRTFKVPCSKEEEPQLIAAVEYLDGKMRAIRENSKVIGVERTKQPVEIRPGRDLCVILTHYHVDHVLGFPFFAPVYAPSFRIRGTSGSWNSNAGTSNGHAIWQ